MNNSIARILLVLSLIAVIIAACGTASNSTTEADESATVDSSAETVQVEATETPASEARAEEAPVEEPADTAPETDTATYTLVETGQGFCYNSDGERIDCPAEGEAFYGQDAQFTGAAFDFTDNGDSTVSDNVTNLVWQQTPDSGTYSWEEAQTYCESLSLSESDDWRMPSLKELFSISNFSAGWPYLDINYFDLISTDEISKDEQYWASDYYVGQTAEGGYDAAFGVNHATGHIKAYPALVTGPMGKYVRCVQGEEYLINDLVDNNDGAINDNATGLMWTQDDSGEGLDWESALAYAQEMNDASYLGYSDWRLPNVKELQSIVDYDYAPDAEDEAYDGPALDPMFNVSEITNEAGVADYPYYWTSTSARFTSGADFYYAWYVAAGRAVNDEGVDYHGAGAVRFDTKAEGGPAAEDAERYYNYVRLVRGGDVTETPDGDPNASDTSTMESAADNAPNVGDGAPQGTDSQGMPGMAAAAEALGVTEEALMEAMGEPGEGPDFEAASEALGVTVEELQNAMGDGEDSVAYEADPDAGEADSASTDADSDTDTTYPYTIVDTDQAWCFSDSEAVECGEVFVGQDAQYEGLQPAYQDNGDGTITDLNTGLMWIQDAGDKTYYTDAIEELETYTFAGYDDWRLPTIKELYSLALFSGVDASMASSSDVDGLWPLIDDDYFIFLYGDESGGNRVIDSQWLTSSIYVSTVNDGQSCFFGFNFSDGRIKCYGLDSTPAGGYFAQYVRGGEDYGVNDFVENGDDTITDNATGLTWTQNDSGEALDYDGALNYCEALSLGGSDDWRLPNIKELHSLVDYSRSPDTTDSAAIDPLFNMTQITNEAGEDDYGFYWSSTTLISYPSDVGWANYISFGRALGYQEQYGGWVDVHGAGAQRSDPKVAGDEGMFEYGNGPQGDAVRQYNYVLCVSGGVAEPSDGDNPSTLVLSDVEMEPTEGGDVPTLDDADTQEGPGAETPDLTAVAAALGISEQELMDALGDPPPDMAAAAEALGISAEELQSALGVE